MSLSMSAYSIISHKIHVKGLKTPVFPGYLRNHKSSENPIQKELVSDHPKSILKNLIEKYCS
jgi:hypothetical protein